MKLKVCVETSNTFDIHAFYFLLVPSQIVWVASESLGVGRALHDDLCVVVAFYEPPGNMEGSFGDNVLRMGSAVRQRKSKEPRGSVPPTPGESCHKVFFLDISLPNMAKFFGSGNYYLFSYRY